MYSFWREGAGGICIEGEDDSPYDEAPGDGGTAGNCDEHMHVVPHLSDEFLKIFVVGNIAESVEEVLVIVCNTLVYGS